MAETEMAAAGILTPANGHAMKRLVQFRVQYERAARQVAETGAVIKAKRSKVPQYSPYWIVMRQADTDYQVRGRYVPANPRETLWSDWLAVTTPNILISERDIVQSLLYQMQELQDEMDRRQTRVENGIQTAANSTARSIRDNVRLRGQTVKMVDRIEVKVEDATASIEEVREVAASAEGAVAELTTTVQAGFVTANAAITTNAQAMAALDFSFSSYQVTVSAQLGSLTSSVTSNTTAIAGIGAQQTIMLDVNGYVSGTKQLNGGPGASFFTVLADFFRIAKPGVAGGAPGAWSSSVTYHLNQVVTRNGKAYYAKRETLNDPPEASPDDWAVLSKTATATISHSTTPTGPHRASRSPNGWRLRRSPSARI